MKTRILADCDLEENPVDVEFTNEHLDNNNFVDIVIGGQGYTVDLDQLASAVQGFVTLREVSSARNHED